jgi:D-alanine-D-alanine ligase-like ATP-grasp enzyme
LGHKEVAITKEAKKTLRDGGWKIDDVPSEGEIVFIRRTSHVSAGGEAIDATDEISGAVKRIAVESIQAIPGLHMCGMDVIIDRDGQPHILEINNDPNITTHMEPWEGKSIPAASMVAEAMFPEST